MLKDDESVALEDGKKYRMYDSKDTFIGVFYYVKKEAIVKCDKMFYVAEV